MKNVALLSLGLIGLCAQAEPADVQKAMEQAQVIRFSITVYRDPHTCDQAKWEETVQRAVDLVQLGQQEGKTAEFMQAMTDAIHKIYTRSSVNDGIHGEIKVGIGNGECKCGPDCDCAQKYKGLCPCSAVEGSDCKKERVSYNVPQN